MSETKPLVVNVGQTDTYAITDAHNPITASSRVVNLLMVVLFGVSFVCHIVCLAVMVAIHNELVDKFDPNDYDKDNDQWCVLFYDDSEFRNNKCHVVIYGSVALAVCAFLMIFFLLLRTLCRRCSESYNRLSSGLFSLLDGVEITVTGIFSLVIAIIVTVGKNETCDTLEEPYKRAGYSKSCPDIYIGPFRGHLIQVYNALLAAEITSWVTVILLFVMGVITVIRVLLWMVDRRRGAIHPRY